MKNKFDWITVRLLALILLVTSSGITGCAAPAAAGVGQSDQPRQETADLAMLPVEALAESNREFALDIYRQLYDESQNLLAAPYSLSLALAMTYAGARGETEQQMAEALHFDLPQSQLHATFNALEKPCPTPTMPIPETKSGDEPNEPESISTNSRITDPQRLLRAR